MNNSYKEVTIVIVSHKSKKKILNLIKNISSKFKIIIIENSFDKSIKKVLLDIHENTQIIFSENNGYGSAINLARTYVTTKYFFVLNPDIQKIDDELINVFYESAKELDNNFGALGPRFENVNEKSHKQSDKNKKYGQIDSISGSAMFFCTEVFDKNDGFDENFFLYFEETDYCYRSNKNNFKVYQINSQKINHDIGSSVETTNKEDANKLKNLYTWHFIWSKFYFSKKRFGKFLSIILFTPIIIRILIRILFYKITNKQEKLERFQVRFDGLKCSMLGKKSFMRIN